MDVPAQLPHGSLPTSSSSQATLPQIPGGRYHIVERLSTSAIGAVYKALDTILDRPVAVKCVHLDTPFADHGPDELRERFVREARIAARLQHPNIVTIHDIVATSDRGFIIMEFIEGQSLESRLSGKRRMALPEAMGVIAQLASALDYAHERRVVHRDVKPSNILVSPSLWVWVTDFGIAKSELSTNLTMAGGVLGTPDYMSPEQAKGEDVDARSDLFSLGCILFECVTGEKPFPSPSLTGVLLSIINDEPVFPPNWNGLGFPSGLKPFLHRALEKERERRFRTGAELVGALNQLAADTEAKGGSEEPAEETPAAEPAQSVSPESPSREESESRQSATGEASLEPPREVESSSPAAESVLEPPPSEANAMGDTANEDTLRETVMFDEGNAEPETPTPTPTRVAVDPERVRELKDESRPLRLSPSLSAELHGSEISPEEGFLLSRIDGLSRARDILSMSPMSETETAAALINLLEKELILFGGKATSREPGSTVGPVPAPAAPAPGKPTGDPDEATLRELDRLLALGKGRYYAELLGIAANAPAAARKSAFLKIIGTYHPDKFPKASDEIRGKLTRLCSEASEALDHLANSPAPPPGSHLAATSGNGGAPGDTGAGFDKRRYARALYDRALRAFDVQDFWESIQLSRQAVEVDDSEAEYFHLLGRALMQNKKWRKEAADSFRRASELDPGNLAYLGMLGAIYKAEGLQSRAIAILKKAQTLDPDYALPALDGETSVQVD